MLGPAPLWAAAVAVVLGGCGSVLSTLRGSDLPHRAAVAGVPAPRQAEDHCGPAALSALLTWAGRPETPESLVPLVYLPGRSGTLAVDLAREVRARGLLAYPVAPLLPALLAEVAAGNPALVLEQRGLDVAPFWHFGVLTGYDLGRGTVVLHAGAGVPEEVAVDTFRRTWARAEGWALLALPPGRLPAAEDPAGILAALVDLEELGQSAAAAPGYEAYHARWPADWRGPFGLGNARWALGDLAGAESAFRRAAAAAPARPEPSNNLALLARADGRGEEARTLARGAVEAALALGLDPAPFRATLEEVGREP